MPIVTLPVPDVYESSTRPIGVQISKYILKDYAAPKGARILFPGDIGKVAQPKSTISDKRENENNFIDTDSIIQISIDEQPLEDRLLSTAVTRFPDENICIFLDKELGINVKPVYTPVEATINFRLRFRDKTIANRWRDGVKTRANMGRMEVIHKVSYHYGLPAEFIYMIVEMHRIREQVAPLNEDLKGWFQRCFDTRMTAVTNQAGNLDTGIIVIPENQIGILGWFDFTYVPDKNEREREGGTYTCGFDYKFQYDKVTDLVLQYPIIIHNQVLPKTIRDDEKVDELDTISKTMQHSKSLFEFMKSQDPKYLRGIEGYAIPNYDDWLVSRIPRGVSTLFTVLCEVNPDDRRELFNVDDIEEIAFHEDILPFLAGEADFIAHIGKSVFYANMYEGQYPTGMDKVTMDSELNFRTVDEMDLRKINHFHFGVITDFTMLEPEALDRLRKNPAALEIILASIDTGNCGMPVPMSNGAVSLKDMKDLSQCLLNRRYNISGHFQAFGQNPNEQIRRMTTGNYTIVSRRKSTIEK